MRLILAAGLLFVGWAVLLSLPLFPGRSEGWRVAVGAAFIAASGFATKAGDSNTEDE